MDQLFKFNKNDLDLYVKMKNIRNDKKNRINHPMINSMKKKAHDKYNLLIQKYFGSPPKQENHISSIQKFLFQSEKFFYQIKHYFHMKRIALNQEIISANIQIENHLKINRNIAVKVDNESMKQVIKQKFGSFFRLVAQIKPSQKPRERFSYSYFPKKPILYSTFFANIYSLLRSKLTNYQLGYYSFGTIIIISTLTSLIKERRKNKSKNEKIDDIIKNTQQYKKKFDVFDKTQDESAMNYLREKITERDPYTKIFGILSQAPTLIQLGYLIKKGKTKYSIIPNLIFTSVFSASLAVNMKAYADKVNRADVIEQKIWFFRKNLAYIYEKK